MVSKASKELISKIQELKQIKPRKDWVALAKMDILGPDVVVQSPVMAKPASLYSLPNALGLFYQQKLAYAFAVFLFTCIGMFGMAQYTLPGDVLFSVKKMTEQSQASLTGESNLKNSFETLKKRSQDLAAVVANNKQGNMPSAIKEVKDATSSLTDALAKDPASAKAVALEIKNNSTLLSTLDGVSDAELKQTSDILYKIIDQQMIADLQKTTLTESQKKELDDINSLYEEGKYSEALEKILLINAAPSPTPALSPSPKPETSAK